MGKINGYIEKRINEISSNLDIFKDLKCGIDNNEDELSRINERLSRLEVENKYLCENYGAVFNKLYRIEDNKEELVIMNTVPDSINYFNKYPEFFDVYEIFRAKNIKNNSIDINRLYMFVMNIRQILERNVKGAFAELGVYKGNNAAIMHKFCRKHKRKLYLLDTFEGFDEKDLVGVDSVQEKQFADTSLERVKQFVGESEYTHYVKGYFPDSVTNELKDDKFAFVSLDCDLYNPIKSGLEFFFPRLNKGGMIFVHDYSSGFFEGCKKAVDEFCLAKNIGIVLMPDKSGTAVIIKQ